METVFWVVIAFLFLASFVGYVFPVIPGVLVLWAGFALYYFGISREELTILFWISMLLLTVLMFAADFLANSYFVKKYGGTKWGEGTAIVSVIAGAFIIPPFGVVVVPFLAVFIVELIVLKNIKSAILAAWATLLGFLSGTAAKVSIHLLMIVWFLLEASI